MQVNAAVAARALQAQKRGAPHPAEDTEDGPDAKKPRRTDVLSDPRFAAMFEERAFEIDPDSEEYKALHPNAGALPPHLTFSLHFL